VNVGRVSLTQAREDQGDAVMGNRDSACWLIRMLLWRRALRVGRKLIPRSPPRSLSTQFLLHKISRCARCGVMCDAGREMVRYYSVRSTYVLVEV
jgi:hypothetical protein